MQQIFLEIWQDARKFDAGRGSFKTWLLQYAYHRSLNRRKYMATRGLYDACHRTASAGDTAAPATFRAGLSQQEWADTIRAGMAQLNAKERQAIELACVEGLVFQEIAERMKESLPNARNRFYRGIRKLRRVIGVERTAAGGYVSMACSS